MTCYWQIDYMYRYTSFAKFPLITNQFHNIDKKASGKHKQKIPVKIL